MAEIQLQDVSKQFGSVDVIDNLSLSIEANEFIVFLGPSGCGKSTLLRMIAGLETASSGTISIGGKKVDQLPPGQRDVAMVFQNYALYPHMKVSENLAFGLQNVGLPASEINERIQEAARILEIEHLLDRRPAELSGGQRQRVAIGRAIVKHPKAFLFDEPLSNLDAALRVRTRVELAELHQRVKATMIYVTHDQVEAMTLADRIVLLNDRKIEQIGTPMEIYNRPASRFVAGFVGSPAMNFISAKVESKDGNSVAVKLNDGTNVSGNYELPDDIQAQSEVTFGIRPESIQVVSDEEGDSKGSAEVVERLGERTLIHVKLSNGETIIGQARSNSPIKAGQSVGVTFEMGESHIFGADGKCYHSLDAAPIDV